MVVYGKEQKSELMDGLFWSLSAPPAGIIGLPDGSRLLWGINQQAGAEVGAAEAQIKAPL